MLFMRIIGFLSVAILVKIDTLADGVVYSSLCHEEV